MGGFGQHNLRYIFCFRWHGRVLVNSSRETFCDLAGIGGIWSEQVEISFMSSPALDIWSTYVDLYFVSSLGWEGLVQHMLRYIM